VENYREMAKISTNLNRKIEVETETDKKQIFHEECNNKITVDEVEEVSRKRELSSKVELKYMGDIVLKYLNRIIKIAWKTETIPTVWTVATIMPIL
jgi:hypothetical protein